MARGDKEHCDAHAACCDGSAKIEEEWVVLEKMSVWTMQQGEISGDEEKTNLGGAEDAG